MGDLARTEEFYKLRQSGTTEAAIEDFLKTSKGPSKDSDKKIVFGARSVNQHLPSHLDKHTVDWDILTSKDPLAAAKMVEQSLDQRYGGNFFLVEPALHPGTFKVRSIEPYS